MRSRLNLEAVTIQRGRDAGLPTFNKARTSYGLEAYENFTQINPDLPAEVDAVTAVVDALQRESVL